MLTFVAYRTTSTGLVFAIGPIALTMANDKQGRPPEIGEAAADNMTVRVKRSHLAELDLIATNEGRSRSETVRRVIADYLQARGRDTVQIPEAEYRAFVSDQYEYIDAQTRFVRRLLVLFGFLLLVEVGTNYLPLMYGVPVAVIAIAYGVWASVQATRDRTAPPQPPEV